MGEARKKPAKNSSKQKKAALKATRVAKTEKRTEKDRPAKPEEA